ncbi:MAG: type II secretion system F family protein [Pseudomonas sp.]
MPTPTAPASLTVPSFAFEAVDQRGSRREGVLDAASRRAAAAALESGGLFVLDVTAADAEPRSDARAGGRRAVLEFTRALAALLSAGMPLARALSAARLAVPVRMGPAIDLIRREVERGNALATALTAHPQLFPPLYIGVVRAAEKSGDLAGGFEELSTTLERQYELSEKLVSLSIYPALLALVGSIAVFLLIVVVMPRFVALLEGTGAMLPASTSLLLALAAIARRFGVALLIALLLLVLLIASALRTARGRELAALFLLRLPVIGALRRQALAGRFARLTGVLLANGAAVLAALDDAAASMADPVAQREVTRVRALVREGSTLHAALAGGSLFPPLLPQLIAVGEESGKLSLFCDRAAGIFERNAQRALERLVAFLEPAMIVAFGGIVAFVALALLQAVYGINAGGLR